MKREPEEWTCPRQRLLLGSLLALAAGSGTVPAQQPAGPVPSPLASVAAPLVLRGVTVIDVQTGRRSLNQTVVIIGTRIQTLGHRDQVQVPRTAHVIDAKGKYLIPGLWDLHIHPMGYPDIFYPLLIANGVTGARDAGSSVPLATLTQWKHEIAQGIRVGPRLLVSGPSIMGRFHGEEKVESEHHFLYVPLAAARRVVDSLQTAGADMLKIYRPGRELRLALIAEAKRVGLRFGGHSDDMAGQEFSDSGATFLDHYDWFAPGICGEDASDSMPLGSFDGPRCAAAVARLQRNHTWVTIAGLGPAGTLPVGGGFPLLERQVALARRYQPDPSLYTWMWRDLQQRNPALQGDTARLDSVAAMQEPTSIAAWERLIAGAAAIKQFGWTSGQRKGRALADSLRRYRIQLPVVIGTDATLGISFFNYYYPLPGFAVHDVLSALAQRRFLPTVPTYMQWTPLAALQTATLNPALALNATDSLGTIEAGKLADLVLLDADPLQDIWNTRKIRAVVANGRYYDRAALDALLRAAEQAAVAYRTRSQPRP